MAKQRASPKERRRRSGIDDFLSEETQPAGGSQPPGGAPQPAAAEEASLSPRRELVERLPPSQIRPDRFQPRPLLPLELQLPFFNAELDAYQVAQEWLTLAEQDAGHAQRVSELIALGQTAETHGQINPITGAWVQDVQAGYVFQIETGERRFWGAVLNAVLEGADQEPLLRVEVVERVSRARQIIENRHAQAPNAVARAREVAALVLDKLSLEPDPALSDTYAYFRLALDPPGRQRFPKGFWDDITELMQLSYQRVRQILEILRLPTALLELADRHHVPARVLEAVLSAEPDDWEPLVEAALAEGLTSEQVEAAVEAAPPSRRKTAARRGPEEAALRGVLGFQRALARADGRRRLRLIDELADELMVRGAAVKTAEGLAALLTALEARLKRM